MVHEKLLIGILFTPAKQALLKLTPSHLRILNSENANENVMKTILIAMSNENKADSNENFRIYSQESEDCLYKQ